jgi:iron-sulfur cluster repair protein YtfE (RIC family)
MSNGIQKTMKQTKPLKTVTTVRLGADTVYFLERYKKLTRMPYGDIIDTAIIEYQAKHEENITEIIKAKERVAKLMKNIRKQQ